MATVRGAETRRASPGSCVQQVPGFPFYISPLAALGKDLFSGLKHWTGISKQAGNFRVSGLFLWRALRVAALNGSSYNQPARLPFFLLTACVRRGASNKGRQAMKRFIFALLVAVPLALLLVSKAN